MGTRWTVRRGSSGGAGSGAADATGAGARDATAEGGALVAASAVRGDEEARGGWLAAGGSHARHAMTATMTQAQALPCERIIAEA
jgi:hypothetical protein